MANNWKRQKDFSQQDIADRIKGFNHVQDVSKLQLGMQIRYLSTDKTTKKRTLKMGGILVYIDPQKRYLRLKSMISNSKPWSVQISPDLELYEKKMQKADEKYIAVVDWAGSENNLEIFQKVIGESKQAQKNIEHIMKNYDGKLGKLIQQHKKTNKELSEAKKRINYLESKINKGKNKKTGMNMLSETKKD